MTDAPTTWPENKLGDVGQSLIGLTYSPADVRRSGTLVLRSSNIQDGRLVFEDNVYVDSKIPEKIRVREHDVLICVRNGSRRLIGKSVMLDHRVVGQTFGAFMAVFRSSSNPFLQYFFQSDDFKRQIDEHLGATINQITNGSLNSFIVALPSEPEQQVIVNYLQDIDRSIAILERLVTKKQTIKQGMMQQLLTGRIRLPGCTESWIRASIGSVATVTMGQSPAGSSYNSEGRGLPLIQGNADITDRATFDRVWTTASTKTCRAGDVLLTVRAPVGYTAIASNDSCLGRGVCALTSTDDNRFLFHALVYAEPSWALYEQGSTFTAVNSNEVRSFALPWPTDSEERAAVARVLECADAELAVLRLRLDKAQAIKQGMLQQLLTGRVRLPVQEVAA